MAQSGSSSGSRVSSVPPVARAVRASPRDKEEAIKEGSSVTGRRKWESWRGENSERNVAE